MRRARVTLNTDGNFGAGSHERPLSVFLAGSAVFSDYSRYYAEAFAQSPIAEVDAGFGDYSRPGPSRRPSVRQGDHQRGVVGGLFPAAHVALDLAGD
jgi:hypothetical protein